jgi:hypothetical protein
VLLGRHPRRRPPGGGGRARCDPALRRPGRQWRQASVPVSVTLTAVSFATPQLGWAVGHAGVVLHTGRRRALAAPARGRAGRAAGAGLAQAAAQAGATRRPRAGCATRSAWWARARTSPGWMCTSGRPAGFWWWAPTATSCAPRTAAAAGNRCGATSNPRGRTSTPSRTAATRLPGRRAGPALSQPRPRRPFRALATPYAGTLFGAQARAGGELLVYGLRGNALRSATTA